MKLKNYLMIMGIILFFFLTTTAFIMGEIKRSKFSDWCDDKEFTMIGQTCVGIINDHLVKFVNIPTILVMEVDGE